MKTQAQTMRQETTRLENQLKQAQDQLKKYENTCQHQFTVNYDPIYQKAYTIPGDEPGTMGSDWRGPCFVPAETINRWKRECELCGLVQYTNQFEEEKQFKKHPKW